MKRFLTFGAIGFLSAFLPLQKVSSRPLPEINPVSEAASYRCYVVTNEGRAFDLTSLCGETTSKVQKGLRSKTSFDRAKQVTSGSKQIQASNRVSRAVSANQKTQLSLQRPSNWGWLPEKNSYVISEREMNRSSSSGGGSSTGTSGNCNSPDDKDTNGRRCGDRSSSKRPGGR